MNFFVCLALTISINVVVDADITWSRGPSSLHYGSPSHSFPSYDAYRNHIKAKYYAKKAHDLAKLRSSIYGIGYGLYGFRYGSHFPSHFSKPFPLLPFVNKYPVFDLGLGHYPVSHIPHHSFSQPATFSGISGHLTGFGYPKSHHSAYSHSYSYGKGHSYGNKQSHVFHKPYSDHYSSLNSPLPLSLKYIKKEFPGETIIYGAENEPHSHGYEYSYVKETPERFKYTPSHEFGGYDSIYGLRYNDFGQGYDYEKFPVRGIAYDSDIAPKSNHLNLIPFSEVEWVGNGHEEESYSLPHGSSYEKLSDAAVGEDIHSLNNGPTHDKFDSSDLIAYGSKKSEVKMKEK